MIIASQKKKENIVEYLLYMWQIENIVRLHKLDFDELKEKIIAGYQVDEPTRRSIEEWYESLIDMMHREGKEHVGHLQINENVIIDLTDLHLRLLKSTRESFYIASFYKTLPYIVELREKAGEHKKGEIETCFIALYGLMLLRIQGKEVSQETLAAAQQISTFLGLLADRYKKDQEPRMTESLDER